MNRNHLAMKKTAILINFYKKDLTDNEILSLKQCITILGKNDLYLLGPDNIEMDIYLKYTPNAKQYLVESSLFKGAQNYSKYLLSETFYQNFLDYDRILIYQLDCYVFNDELDHWASQNYDYIGSPFFESFDLNKNKEFLGVGNGGFSLRNPQTIYRILINWERLFTYKNIVKSKFLKRKRLKLKLVLYKTISLITFFKFHTPLNEVLNKYPEDVLLGLVLSREFCLLKTPSPETASKFSIEVNAKYLFEMNGKKLPFGCHAWEKYEKEFWEPYILQR